MNTLIEEKSEKKYIDAWKSAIIAETRTGEHGIVHICVNDLLKGDENERQKEDVSDFVYDILCRQAQNEIRVEGL